MCGICGLLSTSGSPPPHLVDEMRARIRHRGPDQGSTDALGPCVLGHQRLQVIDPELGYQPVANESGDVVAVFNGEIYNFDELRTELAANGHEVRGRGDTAVIPHLYEESGPRFVERLEGMFAIALWDAGRRRLVLARDRLGKKPLVWTRLADGTLAFASELKSFAGLPGFRREPDLAALDAYLALQYVPGTRTGIADVHRLAPGSILVVEDGAEHIERYWEPNIDELPLSDGAWLERVREEVRAAVRKRLAADVPLGALLSGGIDSSIVVALMAQLSSAPVRTFTVGFADAAYDERTHARAVAERWSTEHEEIVLDPDVSETLPLLADSFDEPLGDEAALPLYLVCAAARREVTVALVGDGGDESFAGYERYAAIELAARLPRPVASAGARLTRLLPGVRERRSTLARAARFLDAAAAPRAERYGNVMQVLTLEQRAALWSDEARSAIGTLASTGFLLGPPPRPGTTGLQLVDIATYLPGDLLPKSDIASMAHSLELRSPLLDHRVVELGLSLPDSLRRQGRVGKIALRRAFADDLPSQVAERGKAGFALPLARWFRGELRPLARELLLDERARGRGWFRPATIERLLEEHDAGHADHGHRIWTLAMLELWQRAHVDADAHRPATTSA
ncbi:MAG TPA: asparagine synthase (glutamine-hydrolyzing) [Gaiellaceae bacterium]|nr:asparagine synthase (glutamine-hydrolyzing) [Gaiellaceae bacterium]